MAGISTPNIPASDIVTELMGNKLVGGVKSTVLISLSDLAELIQPIIAAAINDATLFSRVNKPYNVSAAYTVSADRNMNTIVMTGDALYEVTLATPGIYGSPFTATFVNASFKRGKRLKLVDSLGTRYIMIYPGRILSVFNLGMGFWMADEAMRGTVISGRDTATAGAIKLYVKPSADPSGSGNIDYLNDGLGTDAPLRTVGRAENIFCYGANVDGASAIAEIMAGEIVRENLVHQFAGPHGNNQMYIQAADGGATWAHNAGAAIQARDGGICTVRRAPGGTGTLRFVSADASNNPAEKGVALYASQMSVIDTEDGVEFGSYPLGAYTWVEDAWMNIKAGTMTLSGGAASGFRAFGGGRLSVEGGVVMNQVVNTNYDATYGGMFDVADGAKILLGQSIAFIGGKTHSGRKFWNRQLGRLYLSGNVVPGAVAGLTDATSLTVA